MFVPEVRTVAIWSTSPLSTALGSWCCRSRWPKNEPAARIGAGVD